MIIYLYFVSESTSRGGGAPARSFLPEEGTFPFFSSPTFHCDIFKPDDHQPTRGELSTHNKLDFMNNSFLTESKEEGLAIRGFSSNSHAVARGVQGIETEFSKGSYLVAPSTQVHETREVSPEASSRVTSVIKRLKGSPHDEVT